MFLQGEGRVTMKTKQAQNTKIKKPNAQIIEKAIKGYSDPDEKLESFRQQLTKNIKKSKSPELTMEGIVESALVSEYSKSIKDLPAYEVMKATIAATLLKNPKLRKEALGVAKKYQNK